MNALGQDWSLDEQCFLRRIAFLTVSATMDLAVYYIRELPSELT
jgi:hypothetical protein